MRRTLVFSLWCGLTACVPALAGAAGFEVVSSDAQTLRLRVTAEGAALRSVQTEAGEYQALDIPGFMPGGEPGLPLIPSVGRWIVVPPTGEVRVRSNVLGRESLGAARLVPAPTPERQHPAEFGVPELREVTREGEDYGTFRIGDADIVRLAPPVWARRQRMAALTIQPVLYDAATGRLEVITELEIEISFSAPAVGAPEPGEVDRVVLGGVLNPRQAASWRTLSPGQQRDRARWSEPARPEQGKVEGILPLDPAKLLSDEIRVRVPRTGMYRIRMADLIDSHGFPTDVTRETIRLYQKRPSPRDGAFYPQTLTVDVPLSFVGDPDPQGLISPDDWLVFYGLGVADDAAERVVNGETFPASMAERPDNYNSNNVYVLAAVDPDGAAWARMPAVPMGAAQGAPRQTFRRVDQYQDAAGYKPNPTSLEQQRFFWNASSDKEVLRGVEVFHPVENSAFQFTFTLVRRPQTLTSPFNVIFQLTTPVRTLNLGSVDLRTGFTQLTPLSFPLNTNDIGTGVITFRMTQENANVAVASFLGSITCEYDAYYQATSNRLEFHTGQTGGIVDLQIDGFTDPALLLYDVTDPYAAQQIPLQAANLVGSAPNLSLSLSALQQDGEQRKFVAATLVRLTRLRGADLETDAVPDVVTATGPSEVLVVGPAEFAEAIQPWLDHRRQTDPFGWTFAYVDVQQIYDQFSSGLKSPAGIKDFVEYAYTMWDARALVLVGDGNENTREVGDNPVPDHVPPSLHRQFFTETELLASDKWYGLFCTDTQGNVVPCVNYPGTLTKGPDMLVGRLPANDVAELDAMVAKILAYEQPTAADDWRKRTLWMADDPYSSDYIGTGEPCYTYRSGEEEFASGQRINADIVNNSLDGVIEGVVWDLDDKIDPSWRIEEPCGTGTGYDRNGVINQVSNFVVRPLLNLLSQGWLMVSYQGHAAYNVLAHETILVRTGLPSLTNNGKPFLFFGMGCHVSDFLQAEEGRLGKSMGEEFLVMPSRGAIATYGSSGFEFLQPNRTYMEYITRNFFERLEDDRNPGQTPRPPISSDPLESVWILGEQMAQSEMEILASNASSREEMMAQYNLLGDPLLRMDEAPPRVAATGDGNPLTDGAELVPASGSEVALGLDMVDFAGVDRVEIADSEGRDYTSLVQYGPGDDPRQKTATVTLPIYPQGYTLTLSTYDGSYREARPAVLNFVVPFELTVTIDDVEVSEGEGNVAADAAVVMRFTSPIALTEPGIDVSMDGGILGALTKTSQSADGRQWDVGFAVASVDGTPQRLHLLLNGVDTPFDLSDQGGPATNLVMGAHYPFPNPARDDVTFVAETSGEVVWCRLEVYDLGGRALFNQQQNVVAAPESSGGWRFTMSWNGRDNRGDDLANGVYLYRLEAGDGSRTTRSSMGRVVMMR